MVGLVIVSHSARLAEGVAELARGMAGPDVLLAATGGLDLPDRPLGTDANLVLQAIEQVYSDDGVLILMDLGSALLSTEMALDALPPEKRDRILLCEAPLVEGALAAAVQARIGATLDQVAAEARGALAAKIAHLGGSTDVAPASELPGEGLTLRLTVHNRLGLHARPAARFVQTAARFAANISVRNLTSGRGAVNAKSINLVATLGVRSGHEIEVIASGPQADEALAAIQALADDNFGDDESDAATQVATPAPIATPIDSHALAGHPASPGIAIGPARLFRPAAPSIPTHPTYDPRADWDAIMAAIDKTRAQIRAMRDSVEKRSGNYTASLFDAHLLILEDSSLLQPVCDAIFDDKLNAAAAWARATENVADAYRALDDEYLSARAADVIDVQRQVLLNLLGETLLTPVMGAPGILVAPDLTPADTARLDPTFVLGICTAFGGPTSHSAILARSFGIPAVVGVGESILNLNEDTQLIIDGASGQVWIEPDADRLAEYAQRVESERIARESARVAAAAPAITHDGRRIEVAANIGSPHDASVAVREGAESVGLFRTEFLFLDRQTAPDEEEQYAVYRVTAEALEQRSLIIRTLDAGGDKPLPYLNLEHEANPFLGWRAIRLCLAQPEFFKTQLRAIVRVAAEFPVKVMFPMIATLDEWRAARSLLLEACDEVRARSLNVPDRIETGIMVEIPSAALRAEQFASEVDFFSIGTNDLTQYTLAAERGNARVATLADAFHPAVLQLIHKVVQAAHAQGKWVGVCGELAGDALATELLVGLGVDELSMSAPSIPSIKQIMRTLESGAAGQLAQAALAQESAAQVRQMLNTTGL